MSMQGTKQELAAATVARWKAGADSHTADLARRMFAGEWIGRDEVVAEGASGAILGQIRKTLRNAGIKVEERRTPGATDGRLRQYRVTNATPAAKRTVKREPGGGLHPELGSVLTVRALGLTDHGELSMQLANGSHVWTVFMPAGQQGRKR